MDALPVVVDGQSPQPPATVNADNVKQSNKKKRVAKKRKPPRNKASTKATKRPRSQNKGLKSSPSVNPLKTVDPSNHSSILTDVSKGRKKRRKKPVKKDSKKVVVKKQIRKPTDSTKGICKSNLDIPAQELTNNLLGEESGHGLDGPREADNSSNLGNLSGAKVTLLDQEISHNSNGDCQKEPEGEVAKQHVTVGNQVLRLINWEHFGLIFEEYCMCTEVSKR